MSELLQHIIDEAKHLPQEIIDMILAQFLHKQKVAFQHRDIEGVLR
jgi:sister-chromatid-cohesion protein PDS5